MAIVRVQTREKPFVQVDKTPINDDRLSWKAKGILIYLISKPNDWKVRVQDLVKHAKDGKAAVYSGLEELAECGYIIRQQIRDEDGTFSEMEYLVFETPQLTDSPYTENQNADKTPDKSDFSPHTENRYTENPHPENRTYTNNDLTNNDLTNNEKPMVGWLGDKSQNKPEAKKKSVSKKKEQNLSSPDQSEQKENMLDEPTEDQVKQDWLIIKSVCEKYEIEEHSRQFFKTWKNYYRACPAPVAAGIIREMMEDQYPDFTGKNKIDYKNISGLFHHRMKVWREMAIIFQEG